MYVFGYGPFFVLDRHVGRAAGESVHYSVAASGDHMVISVSEFHLEVEKVSGADFGVEVETNRKPSLIIA